jgi:CyaY protein
MAMTESEFLQLADQTLVAFEESIEQLAEGLDIDIDIERQAYVLTLDFDRFGKIIVNAQAPMAEMWVAAKSGGFHFARKDGQWCNTRDGEAWGPALSRIVSAQLGQPVVLPSL